MGENILFGGPFKLLFFEGNIFPSILHQIVAAKLNKELETLAILNEAFIIFLAKVCEHSKMVFELCGLGKHFMFGAS